MAGSTNKDSHNLMHLIKEGTVGAEIGVWMANTSKLFLACKPKELHLVDPYSVEPYKDNSEASFDDYLSKYQKQTGEFSEDGFSRYYDRLHAKIVNQFKNDECVTVHRMQSDDWFSQQPEESLDWIYVDGDHSYEGCYSDLCNALSVVKKGGMILGDDYGWPATGKYPNARDRKPGVTRAVDQVLEENNLDHIRHGETQFQIVVT